MATQDRYHLLHLESGRIREVAWQLLRMLIG